MRHSEVQPLLTPAVRNVLAFIARHREAYTPDALIAEGIPPVLVNLMLVRESAPLERAKVGLTTRRRTVTQRYVWGPDIAGFLRGWE